MKKLSKLDKLVIILAIPIAIFIIYGIVIAFINKTSLSNNIEYTYAVVDSIHSSVRGRMRLHYDFLVKESQIRGTGTYYAKNIDVSIGDSIPVVYDNTNPENNQWLRNYNTDKWFLPRAIPILLLTGLYYFWKWWRKKKKQEVSNIDSRN